MLTLVAPPDVDGTKLWDSEPFLSYIYIYISLFSFRFSRLLEHFSATVISSRFSVISRKIV